MYGLFPVFTAAIAVISTALGIIGYMMPDKVFFISGPAFASFIVTNTILMLIEPTAIKLRWSWHAWILCIGTFVLCLTFKSTKGDLFIVNQNIVTSIVCAFGGVSALSYHLMFFFNCKGLPFEFRTFMTYPSTFSWTSPLDVLMLTIFLFLAFMGIGIASRRDKIGTSPGFEFDYQPQEAEPAYGRSSDAQREQRRRSSLPASSADSGQQAYLKFASSASNSINRQGRDRDAILSPLESVAFECQDDDDFLSEDSEEVSAFAGLDNFPNKNTAL